MLPLPVAVLVPDVGRAAGDAEREERQQRRDQVRSGVRGLGDEAEAVRREPGDELERDECRRGEDGEECRPALRGHAPSETEEPAEAGSSLRLRRDPPYDVAMSPLKTSFSIDPAPLPRSCQWWNLSVCAGAV